MIQKDNFSAVSEHLPEDSYICKKHRTEALRNNETPNYNPKWKNTTSISAQEFSTSCIYRQCTNKFND